jgi:CHAT domain-containing protein
MVPTDTAVVEYWLGESRSYAWVVKRSRVRLFDLGPSKNLNEAARRLNESMSNFMGTSFETRIANERALHALILAPLAAELRGSHTLYVVPDGSLHQVAFATLVSSSPGAALRFAVDDHDIGVIPSVASYANEGPPVSLDGRASVLIVSDPVYGRDDARFGERASRNLSPKKSERALWTLRGGNVESLERLPGSEREAQAIAGLFDAARTQRLSGFEANREMLLSRDLSSFSIVHFATHSVADVEAPQLSALVLSTFDAAGKAIPGEVFAGDLLGRRLDAELVVLSGCDSSLGEEYAGEGLLGLRYAAHAAGVRSVVASLWPVADAVGPRLMREFYSRATRGNVSAIAALSQAMRAERARWRDPALWGVFQISHAARAQTLH